jgi:hypothetical protein
MNSNLKVFLTVATCFFLCVGIYFFVAPRHIDQYYYYSILDSNEPKTEVIAKSGSTDVDLRELDKCKDRSVGKNGDLCYLNFYKDYTIKYGPEKALAHLSSMMDHDTTIVPGCHYITHGIGEGTYIINGRDLDKSFNFDVRSHFKNIGSCGNGFFHGITIGLTRNVKNDDGLYNTLLDFCKPVIRGAGLGEESCTHGMGHAITIYYEHDREKSLAMCDRLFAHDPDHIFGCYTGVMMEYGQLADFLGLFEGGISGLKDCYGFEQGSKKREACVVEGSGLMRFGENYIEAAKSCQELVDRTERKACTKLTVIHAIRLGRSQEAVDVCRQLDNYADKINCTAFYARYLASAVEIDGTKPLNLKVKTEVCHTLDLFGYIKCKGQIAAKVNTFESSVDYGFWPSMQEFKSFVQEYL